MKTKMDIQEKIDKTLSAFDTIEDVNVSPFFKDKTLQRLFFEKEEAKVVWSWFTPKLQLATLVCVIILNVFAITNLKKTAYQDNVSEFALSYGLSTSNEISMFN